VVEPYIDPIIRQMPDVLYAIGGLKVANRVLGPSIDEVGEALRRVTERKLTNVGNVIRKADKKSQDRDGADGELDLRAADAILREAMVAESEVASDYLGGVLASARSQGSGDDAVAWSSLISRMSTRELTLHYMIYTAIRNEAIGHHEINFMEQQGREQLRSFIPYSGIDGPGLMQSMSIPEWQRLSLITTGLDRERLFEQAFSYGQNVKFDQDGLQFNGGLEVAPSFNGMNLFMWGHGLGAAGITQYLDEEPMEPLEGVNVPKAYLRQPLGEAQSRPNLVMSPGILAIDKRPKTQPPES
jgi:hypothetical protein